MQRGSCCSKEVSEHRKKNWTINVTNTRIEYMDMAQKWIMINYQEITTVQILRKVKRGHRMLLLTINIEGGKGPMFPKWEEWVKMKNKYGFHKLAMKKKVKVHWKSEKW